MFPILPNDKVQDKTYKNTLPEYYTRLTGQLFTYITGRKNYENQFLP